MCEILEKCIPVVQHAEGNVQHGRATAARSEQLWLCASSPSKSTNGGKSAWAGWMEHGKAVWRQLGQERRVLKPGKGSIGFSSATDILPFSDFDPLPMWISKIADDGANSPFGQQSKVAKSFLTWRSQELLPHGILCMLWWYSCVGRGGLDW